MPQPWTVESVRIIHSDRWVTLAAERVRTGRGRVLDPFNMVTAPTWVLAVPVLPDGRVVVVEQYRHAVGRVVTELPAGNVEPGEDPALAAVRELEEETGYRALGPAEPLGTLWPEPARLRSTATGFLVRVAERGGEQRLDAGEDIAVGTASIDELLGGRLVHGTQIAFLFRARERLAGR